MTPLLQVEDLRVALRTRDGEVHAVNGFSLELERGAARGLVGESGSGKSMVALTVLGLLPRHASVSARALSFADLDLRQLRRRQLERLRGGRLAMIFQDPMSSLNPILPVGRQISETLQAHLGLSRRPAAERAIALLDEVGIADPERRARQYPHQYSGGMRQRAMIALAISCEPELLIADEPTTALDATVQAQILCLLERLVRSRDMALLLITHDLGTVARTCSDLTVMYGGMEVETGPVRRVLDQPRHPYTRGLLRSLPTLDPDADRRLRPIPGGQRVLRRPLTRCAFAERCPAATETCTRRRPGMDGPAEARAACFHPVWGEPSGEAR